MRTPALLSLDTPGLPRVESDRDGSDFDSSAITDMLDRQHPTDAAEYEVACVAPKFTGDDLARELSRAVVREAARVRIAAHVGAGLRNADC